jgi:L-cystine uptake protein TcyP (sodium:dicarboxylate symporter family)
MSGSKKPGSARGLLIDTVFTVVVFLYFLGVAKNHVPSNDPVAINLVAAFTSSCITAVFWMAWQMVKVVYRHQQETHRDR